ncbi:MULTISPECIES: ABC transporter permease [Paenibacillus]|uniref:ABC transporter permease n=1 Tax=Paenibacillus TaxID=44249 RepID=UPI00203E1FC6|nr:ABC transporter permease subunit [Paenibacillus illinoisensis]MCM3207985.1 ABC transporter permease subunit [Paenibacillus illinoisensis]
MSLRSFKLDYRSWIVIWILSLLLLWEGIAWILHMWMSPQQAASRLPYLHDVLAALVRYSGTLAEQGAVTFGNAAIGFAGGAMLGLMLALLMSAAVWLERTLSPYVISSQMIPIIGLAPIVYGIIHHAEWARIVMAAYVTFFPIVIHTLKGLKSAAPEHLELMRSCGASLTARYIKCLLPSALPGLFSGMKIAAPLAVTSSIVVELMGAPDGLGVLMVSSLYYGSAQVGMFWATIMLSIGIGLISYLVISLAERWLTPWQPEFRAKGGNAV